MTKIIAFFTAMMTWFTMIFSPAAPVEGIFAETDTVKVQTEFDEGEFSFGKNDIMVSPDGDDSNDGTENAPVKSFAKAKELANRKSGNDTVTVWFRSGTYFIEETTFTSADRQNVLFRSYPYEKVEFTGAKEISGWSETIINGVNAFVTDVEINSDDDYFRSLFKDNKRLSRSQYPKNDVLKIANPATEEGIPSEWNVEFFTHGLAFYAHKKDVMNFANINDVEVKVMHYWCDEHLPLHSVDTQTGRIETSKPTAMTLRVDDNYIFENVKEALSLPGEWYLDRSEQKLY